MPRDRFRALLAAVAHPPADALSDADLLARFAANRDEAAFEALVWRHGPAVRAVCRGELGPRPEVDDAFQATFLVLAKQAGTVRDRTALGGWLYRVAARVSIRLRQRLAKQVRTGEDLSMMPAPAPQPPPDAELRAALDAEIAKLPEKYRLPVQLCYVAGHTTADAALRLGVPKGTLLTRLAWARKKLQETLTARGVTVGAFAAALAGPILDPTLVRATTRAAAAYVAGSAGLAALIPSTTVSLSDGVLRTMMLGKLKLLIGATLIFAAAGIGTVASGGGQGTTPAPATKKVADAPKALPAPPPLTAPVPTPPVDVAGLAMEPSNKALMDELRRLRLDLEREKYLYEDMRAKLEQLLALNVPHMEKQKKAYEDARAKLEQRLAGSVPPMPTTTVNLPLPPPSVHPAAMPTVNPPAPPQPDLAPPTVSIPRTELPLPSPVVPGKSYTIGRPTGSYHRSAGGHSFTLKFENDRLTITNVVQTQDGAKTVLVEADYRFTKDGVVFGYITGVDGPDDQPDLGQFADVPFSFRFRADDGTLTVKDVKIAAPAGPPGSDVDPPWFIIPGRYTDKPQPAKPRGMLKEASIPPADSAPFNFPAPPRSSIPPLPAPAPSNRVPPRPPVVETELLPPPIKAAPTERAPPLPAPMPRKPDAPSSSDELPPAGDEVVRTPPPTMGLIRRTAFDPQTGEQRSYYERVRLPAHRTGDPFIRPDGSSRLLSPGRNVYPVSPPDMPLPAEPNRDPSR